MKLLIVLCVFVALSFAEDNVSLVEDEEDYAPYQTAIEYLDETYGIMDECKTMHQACMGAATTMRERVKCFIQLGLCVGAKAVGCSKTCVMPLIQCKIAAGHDWPAVFQCCKDFISCAVGGCKDGEQESPRLEDAVLEEEDYTPYETAIGYLQQNYGIADECKTMHQACMGAATTMHERVRCFVQLGLCVGAKVVGCSKQCVMPLIQCKIAAGHDWPATFQCCKDFISCAIGGCKGQPPSLEGGVPFEEDEYSPYETAITLLEENYGIVGECKTMHQACMGAATTGRERVKCFIQLGLCVGARVVGCSKTCVMPLIQCKIAAGHNWPAVFQCCKDFIQCAIGGCKEGEETSSLSGEQAYYSEADEAAIEMFFSSVTVDNSIADECRMLHQECVAAASGIIQRGQCLVQLGLCLGSKLVGCSKDCIPPMLECKLKNLGNFPGLIRCSVEFLKCAIGGCTSPGYLLPNDEGVTQQCREMYHDCSAAASGIVQKGQCLIQLGLCVGAKLVSCSKDCIAPMLMCKAKSLGDFQKLLHCNIEFVKCAIGGCKGTPPLELAQDTEVAFDGGIVQAKCQEMFGDCMSAARSIIQRGQCVVQLGLCLGAKLVECSKDCIPTMLLCKSKAIGDFHKLLQCNIDFVKCAIGGCKNMTGPLATYDGGVQAQCQELYQECSAAASGIIQRGQCLVQLGLCLAARLVSCSKDCIAPMLMCKSKALGSFHKLLQCNIDFVKCAIGGCANGTALMSKTELAELKLPAAIVECNKERMQCMQDAAGDIKASIKCTLRFYFCVMERVSACAKPCLPDLATCRKEAGGDWRKVKECVDNFAHCLAESCKLETPAEEDYSPYETAVSLLEEKYGIADECKTMHQACMGAATTGRERIKCFIQLGLCIGAKVVGCSKTCVMPLIQCKIAAGHDWPAVFQCCKDFIQCAIGGCKGGEQVSALEFSPEDAAVELYFPKSAELGIADECREMHGQCMSLARNPIQRIQCLAQLGLCLGAKVVGCSKDCIAPLIACKIGAIGSWIGTFKCCADFIKCAIGGCSGGGPGLGEFLMVDEDISPYEMAISTLYEDPSYTLSEHFKQCKATNDECIEAAGGDIKEKVKCFLSFGYCIGKEIVGCSAHCLPPLAMCELAAKGSWVKTFVCASQFVMCAKKGCIDPKVMLDTVPLISNNGTTEKGVPKACKDENEKCLKESTGIIRQLFCATTEVACISKAKPDCNKQCLVPMIQCTTGSFGDIEKTVDCFKGFAKCADEKC